MPNFLSQPLLAVYFVSHWLGLNTPSAWDLFCAYPLPVVIIAQGGEGVVKEELAMNQIAKGVQAGRQAGSPREAEEEILIQSVCSTRNLFVRLI